MGGAESRLQTKILKFLNSQPECCAFNQHGSGYSEVGVPDVLACIRGRFVGLEVKVDNEQPTKIQRHQIERIRKSGGGAWVVRSLEEAKKIYQRTTSSSTCSEKTAPEGS